jgi:nucleotide-binding universal stress UspA family protein
VFHKILVPLDGSTLAEQALTLAATVAARAGGASGSIELVLVDTHWHLRESLENGDVNERIYLAGIAEEASRLLGMNVSGVVLEGNPPWVIVQRANDVNADLIVMSTHGRTGLSRALLGSVADAIVRDSGKPVLLHRPVPGRRWRTAMSSGFHRILVPLDGTDASTTVLGPVLDMCRWMEAQPVLARVVLPVVEMTYSDAGVPAIGIVDEDATRFAVNNAQQELTQLALDIEAERRIRVETSVTVSGDIGKSLVEVALRGSIDLVGMMTHSRGPTRLFVGSVADRLLREATVPLMLLHPHPAKPDAAEGTLHAFA